MGKKAKLSAEQIEQIKERADNGEKLSAIAEDFAVNASTISRAVSGKSHGSISDLHNDKGAIVALKLSDVEPDPEQPRKQFDEDALADLAASIEEKGLVQPITVRPGQHGKYVILCGERRYRAHQLLGRSEILAQIGMWDGTDIRVIQIVENLHRQDVRPLEEARAYQGLLDETGWTVDELAQQLGIKQSWRITERTQLLKLKDDYQQLLSDGQLTPSQATELSRLSTGGQEKLFAAIRQGLCRTYQQLRVVSDRLLSEELQANLVPEPVPVTESEKEAVVHLERRIDAACKLLEAGFKDGEIVAASKVRPHKAADYADKLSLIVRHLNKIEGQLRATAAVNSSLEVAA